MIHELKISAYYFQAVKEGRKTFEIRRNDRGFQAGDLVILREYEDRGVTTHLTGNSLEFKIGYVTNFNQKEDYVVFSLLPMKPEVK